MRDDRAITPLTTFMPGSYSSLPRREETSGEMRMIVRCVDKPVCGFRGHACPVSLADDALATGKPYVFSVETKREAHAPSRVVFGVLAEHILAQAMPAEGARRLRRFRGAQRCGRCGKPQAGKLRTGKRPEGRAPARIMVAALTTYSARRRPVLSRRVGTALPTPNACGKSQEPLVTSLEKACRFNTRSIALTFS